jgi:hypothetical protein
VKALGPLLALFLAACSESSDVEAVQFQGTSEFQFNDVATCISQDLNSAFPRLFPVAETKDRKSFRSYNGLAIHLQNSGQLVELELRWDRPLDPDQKEYLRFCLERAYAKR